MGKEDIIDNVDSLDEVLKFLENELITFEEIFDELIGR